MSGAHSREGDAGAGASPGDGEAALLARLRAGDERAFAALVDAYHSRLTRLAGTFVKSAAVAEEVAQETWLAVVTGIDRFEGRSTLKTWLFRVLVNRARTRGAREARSLPLSSLGAAEDGEPAVDPARFDGRGRWTAPPQSWDLDTPEALLLGEETRACLEAAIAELPERQRLVLLLRDVEGISADEVCNILDVAETNQRVLLHRARSALHRALARHIEGD